MKLGGNDSWEKKGQKIGFLIFWEERETRKILHLFMFVALISFWTGNDERGKSGRGGGEGGKAGRTSKVRLKPDRGKERLSNPLNPRSFLFFNLDFNGTRKTLT